MNLGTSFLHFFILHSSFFNPRSAFDIVIHQGAGRLREAEGAEPEKIQLL
jgi:hypothetical protein